MPQDSVIIWNPGDSIPIPDSILALIEKQTGQNPFKEPEDEFFSINLIIITILLVVVVPTLLRFFWDLYHDYKHKKQVASKSTDYHFVFQNTYPYYRKLSLEKQAIFLNRTIRFIQSKDFEYIGLNEDERMPLLISAAAIQLTFGLENYLLDHFRKIYVMERSYHYGFYGHAFEGHVSYEGIYLAWDSFSKQFEDYQDGSNVGLHEMAHALAYVNFSVDDGRDPAFRQRFYSFSHIARPVFNDIQKKGSDFLGNYAATNYNEFWAVCIENFFERPETFKNQLPELYDGLCRLLNQDPLSKDFIITPVPGS